MGSVFGEGEVEITTLYDLNIFYTKSQWTIDQNGVEYLFYFVYFYN